MLVPVVFTFPLGLVFWAAYAWVFIPEIRLIRRAARPASPTQDGGTVRLIVVANQLAFVAAVVAAFLPWFRFPSPTEAFWAGTALMLAGSVVRRICFRTLGRYFTGAVTVSSDQPVIERGPYRWVRHPSYTAGMATLLGVGVAFGSELAAAILLVVSCYGYLRRVAVEEKALLVTLGEPYRAYAARTKRFIPFVV